MKTYLLLIFVVMAGSSGVFAQNHSKHAFVLDSLPANGIILDKGWKVHAGDDPAWAQSDADDSKWQPINPLQPISQITQAKIGWLRLHIILGKNLQGQTVAAGMAQGGASEIYLNGKLVYQAGKVSADFNQEQIFNPNGRPFTIQFSDAPEQVFAVRYSFSRGNSYRIYQGLISPDFIIGLGTMDFERMWTFITSQITDSIHWAFLAGIFLILSILHLLLYLSYPGRSVNLYFSVYAFLSGLALLPGVLRSIVHDLSSYIYINLLGSLTAPLSVVFYIMAVYALFNRRKGTFFKTLVVYFLVEIVLLVAVPLQSYFSIITYNGSAIIFYCAVLLTCWVAMREKQRGAQILFIWQSIALLFWCFKLIAEALYRNDRLSMFYSSLTLVLTDIVFLCPPIVLSVLLAREYAQTNVSLKHQLDEVRRLSEQTVAQEQEKQQILASQKERLEQEVAQRTEALKHSLDELKSTQAQLIQSEKMASLGELTAGIAHEIQNPLNFVSNFSEVNKELIDEMQREMDKGNLDEARAISNSVRDNEEKIVSHGKRADAIVKGMLQHSRTSSGQKEFTDINSLCDEYLRLSYHGMRAKDKSFKAEMKTDFDGSIGKINIIPQDIGRVILNLVNNAFYAVNEKAKLRESNYELRVAISTKKLDGKVEIIVGDNGNGIPKKNLDKIFQPFFTTKPTGQGTGLGLSLAYDIVKAHGGDIKVQTKEGEGSEFIIQL